jgi:hypothetical protein
MREIIFYSTSSGVCPVENFLDSLSGKQAQKVIWVLKLVKELELIPTKYLKKLVNTDNIWEIRIQLGDNIFRLLGFFQDNNLILYNICL